MVCEVALQPQHPGSPHQEVDGGGLGRITEDRRGEGLMRRGAYIGGNGTTHTGKATGRPPKAKTLPASHIQPADTCECRGCTSLSAWQAQAQNLSLYFHLTLDLTSRAD
jgi:hypothetical protein